MDKFAKSVALAYFKTKDKPLTNRWVRIRNLGKDTLTPSAQLRLEWIISYHTVFQKNAAKTAIHFGISRKTFHQRD